MKKMLLSFYYSLKLGCNFAKQLVCDSLKINVRPSYVLGVNIERKKVIISQISIITKTLFLDQQGYSLSSAEEKK